MPGPMKPAISVLVGRLDQALGRSADALEAYHSAAETGYGPAAAEGRLREIELRYSLGDFKRDDFISKLEMLTTAWRGDNTELEALQILARLYAQEGRYSDLLFVMRRAMEANASSPITHQIENAARKTFISVFLGGNAGTLPALAALAIFYNYRELVPIGPRGDEIIRRIADRLVSVDLLDDAAKLLQYQIDHRLQGAAREQVATRLAVVYLMNREPARALATLRANRMAGLPERMRDQRLLLQSRALSELAQYDLALDVIANIKNREAIRLRSDILWSARRWDRAAEQIELMCGNLWKQSRPLTELERSDVLRAEIGYVLAGDVLGLGRFRERYAAKMAGTPDAHAFAVVGAGFGTNVAEFNAIAHAAASGVTLDTFLHEMALRYPELGGLFRVRYRPSWRRPRPAPHRRLIPARGVAARNNRRLASSVRSSTDRRRNLQSATQQLKALAEATRQSSGQREPASTVSRE